MYSLTSYNSYGSAASSAQFAGVWTIVSLILAVIGGIALYFLFVKKKDLQLKNKFLTWAHSFLRFDTMLVEDLVKIVYVVLALFVTLSSLAMIGTSFLGFLAYLVLGNLGLRLGFEMTMLFIMIWRNTTDIKKSVSDKKITEKSADKKAE